MREISFHDLDESAVNDLAGLLAPLLRAGEGVTLEGDLGAGKTAFARALIRARLGGPVEVPSPTFTLVQIYEDLAGADPVEIWHVDLYRLSDPSEVTELGLEEAFGTAICLIEWPDRLGTSAPENFIRARLGFCDNPEHRNMTLSVPETAWPRFQAGGFEMAEDADEDVE